MRNAAVMLSLLFTTCVAAQTAEARTPLKADVAGEGPAIAPAPAGVAADRVRQGYEQQFAPVDEHHIVFIPNARHFGMLDNQDAVLSEIDAFLIEGR